MSKRGENIYKRSDGRYEGRYKCGFTENGKTIYKSVYAKTYKECKNKLLDAITGYEESKISCQKSMTVNELFGMWFDTVSLTVKVSTLARYREIFKNHIEKALGNMPIQSITTQYLNDFVKKKLKSGRIDGKGGLSSKTVVNIICVIKAAFRYGERTHNIFNPTSAIISPRNEKKEIEVLTDKEIKKLKKYFETKKDYFGIAFELCISTGIRIGELCALTCGDIDVQKGILKICKNTQRIKKEIPESSKTKVIISTPKTQNSIREIPLPPNLLKILKEYISGRNKEEFLFVSKRKKAIDVRNIQKRFSKALEICNIRKVKFHILRHTFATKWVNTGLSTKILSEILGHSSVSITLSLYVHPTMKEKRTAMNKFSIA
ncbi:MAG: site-specific integrase [Firmicutes bacterium]|nr:site-specific integrase [Bacillota bacterium]